MVAISPPNIPSSASATLERLIVWATGALQFACTNQTVPIAADQDVVRRCSLSQIATPDGRNHWVGLYYIPVDLVLLNTAGNKLWLSAQDVSNITLPSAFTTN